MTPFKHGRLEELERAAQMTDRSAKLSMAIARHKEPTFEDGPRVHYSLKGWWFKDPSGQWCPVSILESRIAMRLLNTLLLNGWMIDGTGLFHNDHGNVKFDWRENDSTELAIAEAYAVAHGLEV